MPKYRAYITQQRFRAFEFEADNDDLAWDHMETLIHNYSNEPDRLIDMATESGPDNINLDEIEEI